MTAGRRRGLVVRRYGQEWVTAASAAALLGGDVSEHMVIAWGRRGLVHKVSNGRVALYSWPQVQAAELRTRTAKPGHPRPDLDTPA